MRSVDQENDDPRYHEKLKTQMPDDDAEEFAKAFEELRLSQPKGKKPKNVVQIWNLPPVKNLQKLCQHFTFVCQERIPDLEIIRAVAKDRTQRAELLSLSGGLNKGGNDNVLICSYMIINVAEREHAHQLIEDWNGHRFQGRKLRVSFSKFDSMYDQQQE